MSKKKRKRVILSGQKRLIVLVVLIHVIAWFVYYLGTPIGNFLAEYESVTVSAAENAFPEASTTAQSYTLYHYIVGLLSQLTNSAAGLVLASRLVNAAALVATAGLCASSAGLLWSRNGALWITGLGTGLCPMLVFWTTDVSPLILGVLAFSAGIWTLLRWMRNAKSHLLIISTLSFAIAAALQPVLLTWVFLSPIVIFYISERKKLKNLALATIAPAILIGLAASTSFAFTTTAFSFEPSGALGKTLAFVDNVSGSDGKTFSMHRKMHTLLLVNPLSWGVLLLSAAIGVFASIKLAKIDRKFYSVLLITLLTVATIILTNTGDNSRFILIPALALLAGGIVCFPRIWFRGHTGTKATLVLIVVILGGTSFSRISLFHGEQHWVSDYKMVAEANLQAGNTQTAAVWARKVIEVEPQDEAMLDTLNRANFEAWALTAKPIAITVEIARRNLDLLRENNSTSAVSRAIEGVYMLKLRRSDEAIELWQVYAANSALARIGLIWTKNAPETNADDLDAYTDSPYYFILQEITSDQQTEDSARINILLNNLFAFAH